MSQGYSAQGVSSSTPWPGNSSSRDSSWELVEEVTPARFRAPLVPVSGSELQQRGEVPVLRLTAEEQESLLSDSALDLGRLHFPELEGFYISPDLAGYHLRSEFRIARAVRAGRSARSKLDGVSRYTVPTPRIHCENNWYICLRAPSQPGGFLTANYRRYSREVKDRKGNFHPTGVSHGFPTLIEVAAYLAGAEAQWPPELL